MYMFMDLSFNIFSVGWSDCPLWGLSKLSSSGALSPLFGGPFPTQWDLGVSWTPHFLFLALLPRPGAACPPCFLWGVRAWRVSPGLCLCCPLRGSFVLSSEWQLGLGFPSGSGRRSLLLGGRVGAELSAAAAGSVSPAFSLRMDAH